MDKQILLKYGEVELRMSDIFLLCGRHQVNDNIIGFYFHFLQNKCVDDILLVNPNIAFRIAHCSDLSLLQSLVDELKLNARQLVLLPLKSKNMAWNLGEGNDKSHWSLLTYQRGTNTFFHFDSSHNFNQLLAKDLAGITAKLLGAKDFKLRAVECSPKQTHGYDCALYVMLAAYSLTTIEHGKVQNYNVDKITPDSFDATVQELSSMTSVILDLILHELDNEVKVKVQPLIKERKTQMKMKTEIETENQTETQRNETEKQTEKETAETEKETIENISIEHENVEKNIASDEEEFKYWCKIPRVEEGWVFL